MRTDWDITWFAVAKVISKRSLCVRDQVGAVITTRENRIVATGYNGPPSGFQHMGERCDKWCLRSRAASPIAAGKDLDPNYFDCPSLHAEANALSVCDRRSREFGKIYVTSHCCMGCAKLIANSGLTAVYVDPPTTLDTTHRNVETSYEFLESCGIDVYVS
jgi:dCMP deaminase